MTLSGSNTNFKPSLDKNPHNSKSERILKEPNLPGILNHPVSPVLHGDRDYDEQNEVQRTVITSGITQEDIEFYEQLEEKKEKSWKRRLKQDEEYKLELLKAQSRVLGDSSEDNVDSSDNKSVKKSRSFFEEDNTQSSSISQGKVKAIIKTKSYSPIDSNNRSSDCSDKANISNKAPSGNSNTFLLEGYSSSDD